MKNYSKNHFLNKLKLIKFPKYSEFMDIKLECCGISGNLLSLISNFLTNQEQRVVLNGKNSEWKRISAGVPEGSVLGPLFFLVYINDLVENINSDVKLFAEDTSLFLLFKM